MMSKDAREGPRAFKEKRTPEFRVNESAAMLPGVLRRALV